MFYVRRNSLDTGGKKLKSTTVNLRSNFLEDTGSKADWAGLVLSPLVASRLLVVQRHWKKVYDIDISDLSFWMEAQFDNDSFFFQAGEPSTSVVPPPACCRRSTSACGTTRTAPPTTASSPGRSRTPCFAPERTAKTRARWEQEEMRHLYSKVPSNFVLFFSLRGIPEAHSTAWISKPADGSYAESCLGEPDVPRKVNNTGKSLNSLTYKSWCYSYSFKGMSCDTDFQRHDTQLAIEITNSYSLRARPRCSLNGPNKNAFLLVEHFFESTFPCLCQHPSSSYR